MIYKYILLLFCLIQSEQLCAQSVSWALLPRTCSSLTAIGNGMYRISDGVHYGVIDIKGDEIVPIEYTSITPFYNGIALVLSRDRVAGTLNSFRVFHPFEENYYVLDGQEFYSEGFLTVKNQKGEKGYIDVEGKPMGFDKGYTRIKPYTEGYAAVFRKSQFLLVDENLVPLPITIGVGVVTGGTNFYQGKAIVWDSKGNAYQVTSEQTLRDKSFDFNKLKNSRLDYLSRLVCITGQSENVIYDAIHTNNKTAIPPYMGENGRWGYQNLLPCQFNIADSIIDNLAIVGNHGNLGIIKLKPNDETFKINLEQSSYLYKEDGSVNCKLKLLSQPSVWNGKNLSIRIVDNKERNTVSSGNFQNNYYSFEFYPKSDETTFYYWLVAEGLLLSQGEFVCQFEKLRDLQPTIQILNTKADDKDRCHVRITLKNPNNVPIDATINISGSNSLHSISQRKTLNAKEIIQLNTWFAVPYKTLRQQQIYVKIDGKTQTEKTIPILQPFYVGM